MIMGGTEIHRHGRGKDRPAYQEFPPVHHTCELILRGTPGGVRDRPDARSTQQRVSKNPA